MLAPKRRRGRPEAGPKDCLKVQIRGHECIPEKNWPGFNSGSRIRAKKGGWIIAMPSHTELS
jgi:hypothetical protein